MGWDGVYETFASKLDAIEACTGLKRESVVASRTRGSTVYLAVRQGDLVIGAVALVQQRRGETSVKLMDESMMPYYFEPGPKVLAALTPTSDLPSLLAEGAKRWRAKCTAIASPTANYLPGKQYVVRYSGAVTPWGTLKSGTVVTVQAVVDGLVVLTGGAHGAPERRSIKPLQLESFADAA